MLLAAVQMNSGPIKSHNLEVATHWIREAARRGATLVALPETFSWLGPESERPSAAEPLDGPTLTAMATLARELNIHVLAGSILETPAASGDARLHNTSVLFGPSGRRLAVYRKIHLFDVELGAASGDANAYRESAAVAPGDTLVTAPLEGPEPLTVGLSICYDLRFPELYRELSSRGAHLLTVPAAFTLVTGKDHWETLLRARAIENQAYVLAPAQVGSHGGKRHTYGHAMVVDPWGLVIARASDREGLAMAELEPAHLEDVRRRLPALRHRRL